MTTYFFGLRGVPLAVVGCDCTRPPPFLKGAAFFPPNNGFLAIVQSWGIGLPAASAAATFASLSAGGLIEP